MKLQTLLIISFFASLIQFGQGNIYSQLDDSLTLRSYAFAPIVTDTITTKIEIQEIPSINVGDIGGQLALSLLSGTIFSIGGGYLGSSLSSNPNEINVEGIVGFLLGYSFGVAIGVYVAASNKKYDPNLMELIGSSLLGELAGVLIFKYVNDDYNPNPNVLEYAPLFLPPVFAIVTLNAFQQKKTNITVSFDVQQLPQPNAYSYGMKVQYEF